MRYFEDFREGERLTHGPTTVTEADIVGFAAEFDPQPFHLDPVAARDTLLDGLAASGWHSCAVLMRQMCEAFLLDSASMGSPGVEEVKWLRPVRPGDALSMEAEVKDVRASRSRPEMGLVTFAFALRNQRGEAVMTMANVIMFGRRPAAGG
jgi:acyl dehydratase